MAKQRKWRFIEQSELGNLIITMTDEEILTFYFGTWAAHLRRIGREGLISKEACIQDFVTDHWAWGVTDEAS